MTIKKPLTQRIKELSERQAKIALLDLALYHDDIVAIAVHYAETESKVGE